MKKSNHSSYINPNTQGILKIQWQTCNFGNCNLCAYWRCINKKKKWARVKHRTITLNIESCLKNTNQWNATAMIDLWLIKYFRITNAQLWEANVAFCRVSVLSLLSVANNVFALRALKVNTGFFFWLLTTSNMRPNGRSIDHIAVSLHQIKTLQSTQSNTFSKSTL